MKLCLGTVQLGMRYGINNQIKRQPTVNEGYQILETARRQGITYLDTAGAYGEAESLIGKSGILNNDDMHVITKSDVKVYSELRSEVKKSLERLGQTQIDGLLLHDASKYYNKLYVAELLELKRQGLVNHIGVSVYAPRDAVRIAADGLVDYIQVPYNVFDQRLDKSHFWKLTREKGIKVFARSSFLQGLILMEPDRIPEKLKKAGHYIEKYRKIVHQYGYSATEAALLFAYTNENIDKVVFGVDTAGQLSENIEIIKKAYKFKECREALTGLADELSEEILNPGMWEV